MRGGIIDAAPSKEPDEIVGGEPGLPQDRAQDPLLYICAAMVRDDDAHRRAIRVLQDVMAAGRVVNEEPGALRGADQPRCVDRWQIGYALASSTVSFSVIGPSGAS